MWIRIVSDGVGTGIREGSGVFVVNVVKWSEFTFRHSVLTPPFVQTFPIVQTQNTTNTQKSKRRF